MVLPICLFGEIMKWESTPPDFPDNLKNYKGRFDFPNSQTSPGSPSVSCCGKDWYWFDYGNPRFIAYPEPWSGARADWNTKAKQIMDQAQADPGIKYICNLWSSSCTFHR